MNLKKNIAYNIFYNILILIIPLITAPYVSRILGAEGVGIYSYTTSVAQYFVLFALLGLAKYGNRTIAKSKDNQLELNKAFCNLYAIQVISSLISIIIFVVIFILGREQYKIFFLIQLIYVTSGLINIDWLYFGMEKFKLTVIRSTIIRVLGTLAIFIFVKDYDDLVIYIMIMSLSMFLTQLILWINIRKLISYVKPTFKDIKSHIKPLLVLFIPVIAISIYRFMDKIMITILSNVRETGLYENADKIVTVPMGIIIALGTVMLPRMSNLVAKGDEETGKKYIRDSMQFVMFLSFAMAFGIAAIAIRFAPVYYGEDFIDSGALIKYLCPIIVFIAWANVIRTQYLIPRAKDRIYVISVILGAVFNLVLNLIFIPRYGALGAVFGTISAEGVVMLYQSIMVRRELELTRYINDSILFVVAGALMYGIVTIVSKFLAEGVKELIILIVIAASVYLVLAFLLMFLFRRKRLQYYFESLKR